MADELRRKVDLLIEAEKAWCPQPLPWQKLFELLPNKKRVGYGWHPSLPLILEAWWNTGDREKSLRFKEHIEWAEKNGALQAVYDHLSQLETDDWHKR